MRHLHIDIETYSSISIIDCGLYKYTESPDFEILMVAYAFDDEEIQIVDLAAGEHLPMEFCEALHDPHVAKLAHNALFERTCFAASGWSKLKAEQWHCTAIYSAYCGLPLGLAAVSEALELGDKAKLASGKALIRYFSIPCKPTKKNGQRHRNMWFHDSVKWEEYKGYCKGDVAAEREIARKLAKYIELIPNWERKNYLLDQKINDLGIEIDTNFARNATDFDNTRKAELLKEIKDITGLDNPNSPTQLKTWLSDQLGKEVKSLSKTVLPDLLAEAGEGVEARVVELRGLASKTSTKKYPTMLDCVGDDGRGRGFLQFYGAYRTGRWAGRLVQIHNLPQNHLDDLDFARSLVVDGDYDIFCSMYDEVSDTLSQLIRTAFVAKEGHTFAVADFSAIEARVIAWLSGEQWRLDIFNGHGKIYEASASMMFGVPIEEIGKGSDLRAKGKVAELALGFQGAVGALKTMGGERMGLSDTEMRDIVDKWREANVNIVKMWKSIETKAIRAIHSRKRVSDKFGRYHFEYDGTVLALVLPSGRRLHYWNAQVYSKTTHNNGKPWTRDAIRYKGVVPATHKWGWVDTYGGKLTENLVQAIARDLLAEAMQKLDQLCGYDIPMHVHDEVICEVPLYCAEEDLATIESIMGQKPDWAEGLPLGADGYITPYYKKD